MNLKIFKQKYTKCLFPHIYGFGQLKTTSYPYKFGGIPKKQHNQTLQLFLTKGFGKQVNKGFETAYNAVLDAFVNKDKTLLDSTLQPNLTKNLTYLPVKHVNHETPLNISVSRGYILLGGKFIRTGKQQIKKMNERNGIQFYLNFFSLNPAMTLPIIFGVEVFFQGRNKLIAKGDDSNIVGVQVHSMQFQIQNQVSIQEVMKMVEKQKPNSANPSNLEDMKKIFFGKDYEWRISDIDSTLNGNFAIKV